MTKDGYELHEGDTFWMYVAEADDYAAHTALALADGYVYYDKTESSPDDDMFGRVEENEVWHDKQISYREVRETASRVDDKIECCCEECHDELGTSVLWLVETAYELGRRA